MTGADAAGASAIFGFPAGLIRYNKKGKERSNQIEVRIEQRLAGSDTWVLVEDLTFKAKEPDPFFRQYTWDFAIRGRYEIRLTKLDQDESDTKISEKIQWVGLQTLRPEYPLNVTTPLALMALRIRASHQLSGTLDEVTALVTRICPDYDHATGNWITRATSNPASLYRYALQSPGKTRGFEIWREAHRHMLVAIHRPDTYEVMQHGSVRVATRGDLVALSHDVLDDDKRAARVKDVVGSMIVLDERLLIEPDQSYAIRFRHYDADDTVGQSYVRAVSSAPGETATLMIDDPSVMPAPGDTVMFGRAERMTYQMIVTGVETGKDQTCLIRMVDAAPEIDEILDAAPILDWMDVSAMRSATAASCPQCRAFWASLRGSVTRLAGSTDWTRVAIPAANVDAYQTGDLVEVRARALRGAAIASDWSAPLSI